MGQSWLSIGLGLQGASGSGGTPVPPMAASQFGMNLVTIYGPFYGNPSTPFEDLIYGDCWHGRPAGSYSDVAIEPYVNIEGELQSFEPGVTSYGRNLQRAIASGQRYLLTWTVASGSPTVTVTAFGDYSRTVEATTGTSIRFQQTWATADPSTTSRIAVEVTGGVIQNVSCRRCDAAGVVTYPSATWAPEFVEEVSRFSGSYIRLMDLQAGTENWTGVYPNELNFTWADRATTQTRAALQQRAASLLVGSGNSRMQISGQIYAEGGWTAVSASLPDNWYGAGGNRLKYKENAASGAGSVSINVSGSGVTRVWEVEVTPAAGADSATAIAAQINANATAEQYVVASVPAGTGADAHGPIASTFLAEGSYGGSRDGTPLEWLIELCNLTGCKPYLMAPWMADSTYAVGMGAMIRDTLNSECKPAMIGMGNEPWNFNQKSAPLIFHDGVSRGYTPDPRGENQATRHKDFFTAMFAEVTSADVTRVLEGHNRSASGMSSMLAFSGVPATVDLGSAGPYINEVWPTASSQDDYFENKMPAEIVVDLDYYETVRDVLAGYGKGLVGYEGGQHETQITPLATAQSVMRDPRFRRIYGMYLGEFHRRFPDDDFCLFNQYARITSGNTGSWGTWEYMGQADADAPKALGLLDARAGEYPAYFDLSNPTPEIDTASPQVATPIGLVLPTLHYGSVTGYQWTLDGTPVGGAISSTYTPVGGDVGMVPNCEITVTGLNGQPYIYVTENAVAIIAVTKYDIWTPTRLASNGGVITLPADWTDSNIIHLFGSGGNGFVASGGGNYRSGGGGRSYSASSDIAGLIPGGTVSATIGLAGGATNTNFNSGAIVAAFAGNGVNAANSGGQGGQASAGVGDVKFSGGNGGGVGGTFQAGAGGAGDAGPDGDGKTALSVAGGQATGGAGSNGGASTSGTNASGVRAGDGGHGNSGTGGGTGAVFSPGNIAATDGTDGGGGGAGSAVAGFSNAADGGQQVLWTDTAVPSRVEGPWGGGGGCGNTNPAEGGDGGGGGGGRSVAGLGKDGSIVLEWNP